MPTQLESNQVHEIAIDATGEFYFHIYGEDEFSLLLDGTDSADYQIDAGVDEDTPSTGNWFTGEDSFTGVSEISEHYAAPERWVRVQVTTAASTSGATAKIAVVGA